MHYNPTADTMFDDRSKLETDLQALENSLLRQIESIMQAVRRMEESVASDRTANELHHNKVSKEKLFWKHMRTTNTRLELIHL